MCAWGVLSAPTVTRAQETPLTTVLVTDRVPMPVYVTHAPQDFDRIFIVSQGGVVYIVKNGTLLSTPFLNIDLYSSCCNEQGLLGLAFHPNYAVNGTFFINYTDNAGDTIVARHFVTSDPDVADREGEVVLRVPQPEENHNGGWMEFGPRGYLYIATGDGGGVFDPNDGGQTNVGELLGNILRIDVDGDDWPHDPLRNYAIPPTNPFVGVEGEDEIWAYGLRNPWRNSFDPVTGELYIADVGQAEYEEINVQPSDSAGGENYGWRCKEATSCTGETGCDCEDASLVDPVYEYGRGGRPYRCSVTGGEVYRGCALPDLQGTYFFADYCSAEIWSFRWVGGAVTTFRDRTAELAPGGGREISGISSFGRDAAGELYICDLGGEVFKIVPATSPVDRKFVGSDPPDGAIDARQPSDSDGSNPSGWETVVLTFDTGVPCLFADDFVVSEDGGDGIPPSIVAVTPVSDHHLLVTFDRAVEPRAWTTLVHADSGVYVRLGFLPGDVNNDGITSAGDILDLIDALNGVGVERAIWSLDIDRSGVAGAGDVLQLIDLLNGVGVYPVYHQLSLP